MNILWLEAAVNDVETVGPGHSIAKVERDLAVTTAWQRAILYQTVQVATRHLFHHNGLVTFQYSSEEHRQ